MTKIILESPTKAILQGATQNELDLVHKVLSYKDKRVEFELLKTEKSLKSFQNPYKQGYLISSWGTQKLQSVIAELQLKRIELKRALIGNLLVGNTFPSGVADHIARLLDCKIQVNYQLPEPQLIPWTSPPAFKDRYYQVEAHDELMKWAAQGPCGISAATGAGKSSIVRNLLKTIGLPAIVGVPSVSIALQMYELLVHAFGSKYVGLVGNGKKQYDKKFVVAIDDSLTKIEKGSKAWDCLHGRPVWIADEAHLWASNTLQKVCYELAADSAYRFFVSATQFRNDGLDIVLQGITGPIVYRKEARELIDEGFLAKPNFTTYAITSTSSFKSDDPNSMTRNHLYYNHKVIKKAAELANNFVELQKKPVLILVEELEQFRELLPHLKVPVKFAHSPLSGSKKDLVPIEYHKDKSTDLVNDFNDGKIPVLVGTSCISTGTDLRVPEVGIYLAGGKSEIKVRQSLGRMTRRDTPNPWTGVPKTSFIWIDFDVENIEITHKHANARRAIYKDIYAEPRYLAYTGK